MAIDYQALKDRHFADVIHRYEAKDTILYALGVGCGYDEEDLRYVYERRLQALPSMATVLGLSDFWLKDSASGIDWRQALHGEEAITLHAPLPVAATVVGRTRIAEIFDKGPRKAALLLPTREIFERTSGRKLATLSSTIVLRGHGGFGGPSGPASDRSPIPERAPDAACALRTSRRSALIYRLSGDLNPLHVEPGAAQEAGFPKPILHGLCTLGVATRAILRCCCENEPARLKDLRARFSAPAFPGDTLQTEIWHESAQIRFRTRAIERDVIVLDSGAATVAVGTPSIDHAGLRAPPRNEL